MKTILLVAAALGALLSACGGGSGNGPAASQAPAVPAATESDTDGEVSVLTVPEGDPEAVADDDEGASGDVDGADFAFAGYAPGVAAPAPDGDDAAVAGTPGQRLHVSPKGHDGNPGSATRPLRSIARAARMARPGARILVAPGTYSGGFRTTSHGSAQARIMFVSTTKWGARIVPARVSPNKTAWDNRADYVDIIGFQIDGSAHQGGTRWTHGIYSGGSHDAIKHNHVHHIATGISCKRAGGAAIGVDSYFRGVSADVIANLVHDIGPAGCRFVQGIYVSTSGRIKNNVVYRVAEGGIHLWHDARNVIITNNTITASNTGIIIGGGNFYHTAGPNDHTEVYNNIVYDNRMGISEQGKTGRNNVYRNNLVYQNRGYDWRLKNDLKHRDSVSAPPQFIAYARAGQPNLRIGRDSPAVGKGIGVNAEATDFEGRPRNAQAGFDIGAFQH